MFIIPTYIYIHKHEGTGTGRDTMEGGEKMGRGGGGGSKEAISEDRGIVAFRS